MAEPTEQNQNSAPAPEAEPPIQETVYTKADIEARLRGSAKEIERLKAAESELLELKAAREEAQKKAAEERGEYQRLYEEQAAKFSALDESHAKATERLERYEALLAAEVETQVGAISDADLQKRVKGLLEGRQILDQREILSTFLASVPDSRPIASGGSPGRRKPNKLDSDRFVSDYEYRKNAVLAAFKSNQ